MANLKRKIASLFMALLMLATTVPMNTYAVGEDGIVELVCTKEVVEHNDSCYQHSELCYHKHDASLIQWKEACGYACEEHSHSVENGCPVGNCDMHVHEADCCDKEEHEHVYYLCYVEKCTEGHSMFRHTATCRVPVVHCKKTEHAHGTDCNYICGQSTEHTHEAACYSCTVTEHVHSGACRRSCGMTTETLVCGSLGHTSLICEDESHHEHALQNGCYATDAMVNDAFFRATGVQVERGDEIGAVMATVIGCKTGCKLETKLIAEAPYLHLELVLCKEHFCTVCHRLNEDYCECVRITFTNIRNNPESATVVKVVAGETVEPDAVPEADLFQYCLLGWFDDEGNEFSTEAVYMEDITFTARYKALSETEKLRNIVKYVGSHFNLGVELGRMITILSKGEITKEAFIREKETAVETIRLYLLVNRITDEIKKEQAEEIARSVEQSEKYAALFADWLWPDDAALLPEIDEILAEIDFEKLGEEIKDLIAAEYGVEFTREWAAANCGQVEEAICHVLEQTTTLSEEQKQFVLEQIRGEKETALSVLTLIRFAVARAIAAEIENTEAIVDAILADRDLGIKLGRTISMLSGLTKSTARDRSDECRAALVTAIRMSSLSEEQQRILLSAIDQKDECIVEVMDWLWPMVTVRWMDGDVLLETYDAALGDDHIYHGDPPEKDSNAEFTYEFIGWKMAHDTELGIYTYTAIYEASVNEYTVTWCDEDGSILAVDQVAYGQVPVFTGAAPDKADTAEFDYEFAGFGEIKAVTEDVAYTAVYTATVRSYQISFVDGETVLYSEVLPYGTRIVAPQLPNKKGFHSAWSKEFDTVDGDLTVEVVWKYQIFEHHKLLVYIGYGQSASDSNMNWFRTDDGMIYNARNYYSYYENGKYGGSTVMTEGVDYERYTAVPGEVEIDGITYGNGTGSDYYVINRYVVVATAAQYHLDCHATLYHTITFVDHNGNVIDTVVVEHGADAIAPEVSRVGYVFTGWDQDITNVTNSMTVTAQYDYEYFASEKLKINVGNGNPGSGSTAGNAFSHWGKIYQVRSYFSYYDYPAYVNDSIMSEDDFDYVRTIAEAIPRNVKYQGMVYTNGKGSSENYYVLTGKATFVACKAQYHLDLEAEFYNVVTFCIDGVEYKVDTLSGTEAECPVDPIKDGYEFLGWEQGEDGVFYARFVKLHTVTFYLPAYAGGGCVERIVRDGETVEPYQLPENDDYLFKFWYRYPETHLKGFDFNTPITEDTRFDAAVETVKKTYEVRFNGVVNGEKFQIGTGSIAGIANPKEFYGIYKNVVQSKHYSWDNIELPTEYANIEVEGVTFTYGEGSSENYYTFRLTKKLNVGKQGKNTFYFFCDGTVERFHKVRIKLDVVDGGSRLTKWMNVANGTVINNQWLIDQGYLSIDVVEDVVIKQGGVITVAVVANGK